MRLIRLSVFFVGFLVSGFCNAEPSQPFGTTLPLTRTAWETLAHHRSGGPGGRRNYRLAIGDRVGDRARAMLTVTQYRSDNELVVSVDRIPGYVFVPTSGARVDGQVFRAETGVPHLAFEAAAEGEPTGALFRLSVSLTPSLGLQISHVAGISPFVGRAILSRSALLPNDFAVTR